MKCFFLNLVTHSSKLIKPKEDGACGNLWFIANQEEVQVTTWTNLRLSIEVQGEGYGNLQLVRGTDNNLGLQLTSDRGVGGKQWQCYRTEPLTCGIWNHLEVHSVRIEVNSWTPKNCLLTWGTLLTLELIAEPIYMLRILFTK